MPEPTAVVTAADLRRYVNASAADDDFLSDLVDAATALVDTYTGETTIPAAVVQQAYLETGAKLYQRRNAPMGDYGEAGGYGGQMRLAPKDPMITAYPLLNRYMVKGI